MQTGETVIYICPHAYITNEVYEWMTFYRWACRGVLPNGGGLLDQEQFLIDAFDWIDIEKAKLNKANA